MPNLVDLIGKPLNDFHVVRMTEVYSTDCDGRFDKSVGCLMNEVEARAYATGLADSAYTRTRSVLVLTNGNEAYFLGDEALVADISVVLDSIRKKALAKLTAEEIQVLGLSSV
jgi:hypothetical protein